MPGENLERQADRVADLIVTRQLAAHSFRRSFTKLRDQGIASGQQSPAGRPIDNEITRAASQLLGFDFSTVRIHDDEAGARLAHGLGARAVAIGRRIAFGRDSRSPETGANRRLLAHELVHVAQQQQAGPRVQRAPSGGQVGTDVLTLNWEVHFKLGRPHPDELGAAPSAVLTDEGLADFNSLLILLANDPQTLAQLEGNSSIEGDAGYNLALSARRTRWLANQIGALRVAAAPGHLPDCPPTADGQYACGALHARATVNPADRHVTVRLFRPPAQVPRNVPQQGTPQQEQQGQQKQGQEGQQQGGGTQQGGPTSRSSFGTQWQLQHGFGGVHHFYTTAYGSTDPLNEWVDQVVGAYVLQFHGQNKKGFELQVPVIQVQYSLTTRQWTLVGGPQLSYVLPFADHKFQWTIFAQVLAGGNLTAGSWMLQPAAGTQIAWQPTDWFNISPQLQVGGTGQTRGPSSVDVQGMFLITIQH